MKKEIKTDEILAIFARLFISMFAIVIIIWLLILGLAMLPIMHLWK